MANTLDTQQLLSKMVSVARDIAQNDWDEIEQIATDEFEMILKRIERIGIKHRAGNLSEAEGKLLLDLQVVPAQTVLGRREVLGSLRAQRIITAVFNAIGGIVNRFVGFELIEVED